MKGNEYARLKGSERQYYDQIHNDITSNCSTNFTFHNASYELIGKVFKAVLADNPQFFWYSGGYSGRMITCGSSKTLEFSANLVDDCNPYSIQGQYAILMNKANQIASNARFASSNKFDQVVYVHDYIVEYTDYDLGAPNCHDAYGCLINGRAVCSGYSAAFQIIMQLLGINCGRISGAKSESRTTTSDHEWNYLELDGDYYYIDVTWDDPLVDSGQTGSNKSYDYFMITTKELLLTHKIIEEGFVPKCKSSKYDYFIKRGFYLRRYSFNDFAAIASGQLFIGDKVMVKFSSDGELKKAVKDLIEKQNIYKINGISNRITYSTSKSGLVLTVNRA